jgi:hypothetical protein
MFFLLLPSSGFLHTFPLFHSCYFLSLDFTCRENMWHLSFWVWLISLDNIFFPLFRYMPINVTARSYDNLIFMILEGNSKLMLSFSCFVFIIFTFTYMCLHFFCHLPTTPAPLHLFPGTTWSALLFSDFVDEKI